MKIFDEELKCWFSVDITATKVVRSSSKKNCQTILNTIVSFSIISEGFPKISELFPNISER